MNLKMAFNWIKLGQVKLVNDNDAYDQGCQNHDSTRKIVCFYELI